MKPKWTPVRVKLGQIAAWEGNPRMSTKAQAKRIIDSETKFGQPVPFLLNPEENGRYLLLDGHQRLSAWLTVYGADHVMDAMVADRKLTEAEHKELIITLHTGATGEWNWQQLSGWNAGDLQSWGMNADTLKQWNNDANNLKELLNAGQAEEAVDAEPQIDRAEELREKWQTATGQLWKLGEHRLLIGDCTVRENVERLMGGERATLCLTDPPYGLDEKKDSGKNSYDVYEDTQVNLISLIGGWLPIARELCNAVVFSPGVTNLWLYPHADWVMCWFYGGGQLRSSWGYNCWQPFLCYGKDPSLATGHGGRPDAIDMNTPANADDLDHPCPKPSKLWEWFIGRLSFVDNEILYEPFAGSGTTIIAAHNLNRRCYAMELSEKYGAVILERFYTATGITPELID